MIAFLAVSRVLINDFFWTAICSLSFLPLVMMYRSAFVLHIEHGSCQTSLPPSHLYSHGFQILASGAVTEHPEMDVEKRSWLKIDHYCGQNLTLEMLCLRQRYFIFWGLMRRRAAAAVFRPWLRRSAAVT